MAFELGPFHGPNHIKTDAKPPFLKCGGNVPTFTKPGTILKFNGFAKTLKSGQQILQLSQCEIDKKTPFDEELFTLR